MLFAALWLPAAAAQVDARSDNFRLVSEAPVDGTAILSDLERFRAAVMGDLELDPSLQAPLTLTLTEDLALFDAITPGGITAGIYLQSATGADIVVGFSDTPGHVLADALDPDWLRLVLRHEVVHHILETHYPRKLPIWLGEGLAEYYATYDSDADGLAIFGRPMPGQENLSAQGRWLPMRTVIESLGRYPDYAAQGGSVYDSQRVYYGQVSAIARFVMEQPEGLARAHRFVDGLTPARDSEDSFEAAFGLRYGPLERSIREGAQAGDVPLRVRRMTVPAPRRISTQALDGDVRALNRQRLLLSYGHKTDAVADMIAARRAALPRATESIDLARALDRWRRGDWDGSDAWSARVLARDPGNARALKMRAKAAYGRVSEDQTNEALWAAAEVAALRALAVAPEDAQLHLFRVAVSLPETDRLPAAARASLDWLGERDVRHRLPHEAMMMIPALIYEGRFTRADAVLDNAARWTTDPADLFVIERLRENVAAQRRASRTP